jgi:hypothetical protein
MGNVCLVRVGGSESPSFQIVLKNMEHNRRPRKLSFFSALRASVHWKFAGAALSWGQ